MCDRATGAVGEGKGSLGDTSRPSSGLSRRLASDQSDQKRESGVATQHRREGSEGSTNGLLLSVSALAGSGGKGRRSETTAHELQFVNCDNPGEMGQAVSVGEDSESEGGGEEEDRTIDKSQLEKLRAELKAAHVQLEVKEEQVAKLSKIRDEVEAELEELTASLFQVCLIICNSFLQLAFYPRRHTGWLLRRWQRELTLKKLWLNLT